MLNIEFCAIAKLLTIITSLCFLSTSAQTTKKVIVANSDPSDLYASFSKDSSTLFYEKIIPVKKPVGALVILAGTFESIADIKKQTGIHTLALNANMLVVFPGINYGTNKHEPEHKFLDTIFKQIVREHNIPKDKIAIGGFSGGAMLALTYTQKANKNPASTFIKPKVVFGIDPPLDYSHLWDHCVKDIERNFSEVAVNESKMIMESYKQEFGGSPQEFPENYIRHSIFSYNQSDGGNARYLIDTPLILFTEPDIMWQIKNRQRDYYDLNCVDIAAMINLLQIKGNKNAELVVTTNKGKRLNGMRHPHSWSIMDSQYCFNFIQKHLNN